MFKRIVNLVEVLALLSAVVFVVALFANRGGSGSGATGGPGYDVFVASCATCHGQGGAGGSAPKLAGTVTKDFPSLDDQIRLVERGKGAMPSFTGRLSKQSIRQVVEYTRSLR